MITTYSDATFEHKLYAPFTKLEYAPIVPGSVRLKLPINGLLVDVYDKDKDGVLFYHPEREPVPWGRVHYSTGEIEREIGFASALYEAGAPDSDSAFWGDR